MKNYPAFIGVFLFLLVTAGLQAQTFGFRGGLNLATMVNKDDNNDFGADYTLSPGLLLGTVIEFPLSSFFSIESGLMLSTKGYNYDCTDTFLGTVIYDVDEETTLYYLDIPLTLKVQDYVPSGKVRIFILAGAYAGLGISGWYRSHETTYYSDVDISDEVSWGSGKMDRYRRFDYGLIWGVGIGTRSFELVYQYHYGLENIAPDRSFGQTNNNRVRSLTFGFRM